jgi:UDP-glucuronate 4-epimerase
VVEGTIAAALRSEPGLTYNLGGGGRVSMIEVIDILRTLVDELPIRRRPQQQGDARDTAADISRAVRDLGYSPTWSLPEGLAAQVRWHRARAEARSSAPVA